MGVHWAGPASVIEVVFVRLPEVPVMVTTAGAARALVVENVTWLGVLLLTVVGAKTAATPAGSAVVDKVTMPLKPKKPVTEMVSVQLDPGWMVAPGAELFSVKVGVSEATSALISAGPIMLPHPVTRS